MFAILKSLFSFAICITPLVVIHELGHYWIARMCGVTIHSFSIGFGPVLWRYIDRRGTEWRISLVLLGGYVQMLDGPHSRSKQIKSITSYAANESLDRKHPIERILIALAGPFANFALAFAMLCALYTTVGEPVYRSVGTIKAASISESMGMQPGDAIIAVGGHSVANLDDAIVHMQRTPHTQPLELTWTNKTGTSMTATAPAHNGQHSWMQAMGIERAKKPDHYTVLSLKAAMAKAWSKINPVPLFKSLGMSNMQGPLGIAHGAGKIWSKGWIDGLYFVASLSIGLGLFNLLPLPILDGGVALLAAIEGILNKKAPLYLQTFLQVASFFLVGVFVLWVSWNDISSMFGLKKTLL